MLVCRIHVTTTSRFVPIAKEFLCVMCSFSTANNLSIPTSEPNLFDGFLPWGVDQYVTCAGITLAFSTAVFLNWPANLMCWIVLPGCVVLVVPVAIFRNRQL